MSDFVSTADVSMAWGISRRRISALCAGGRIPGAYKIGKTWVLPKCAEKPMDGRFEPSAVPLEDSIPSVIGFSEEEELLKRFLDFFPYPIHVTKPDGSLIFANKAFLQNVRNIDTKNIFGSYNILKDPRVNEWGLKEHIERAYRGEVVYSFDVKAPVKDFIEDFGSRKEIGFEVLHQNITSFPILDENNRCLYVITLFIITKRFNIKKEIIKGKEYINAHWAEPFDCDAAAEAVGLSRTQFLRSFKKHTGFTPHDYYWDVKISNIKERLLDPDSSIAAVFEKCGLSYNSYYTGLFKKYTGMTPSECRKGQ